MPNSVYADDPGYSKKFIEERKKNKDESAFDNNVNFLSLQEKPIVVWSQKFIYFPYDYDGWIFCGSVPREPLENCDVIVGDSSIHSKDWLNWQVT